MHLPLLVNHAAN